MFSEQQGKKKQLGKETIGILDRNGFLTVSPLHRPGTQEDERLSLIMFAQDIVEARKAFSAAVKAECPVSDRTVVLEGKLFDAFVAARDATYNALAGISELEAQGSAIDGDTARNTIDKMDQLLAVTMMSARSAPEIA